MSLSLGVIETYGLTSAVQAADAACKSAEVNLVGYKIVGAGVVAICFEGEISAVKTAVDNGIAAVKNASFIKGGLVIARPEKQVINLLDGLKGQMLKQAPSHAQEFSVQVKKVNTESKNESLESSTKKGKNYHPKAE